MTSNAWAMMLGIAMQALLFHAMPRFSRLDILFAVTVPEAFASGVGRSSWLNQVKFSLENRAILARAMLISKRNALAARARPAG